MYKVTLIFLVSFFVSSVYAVCPVDQSKYDFSGQNLSGKDFSECTFTHNHPLIFKGTNLTNAVFPQMAGNTCSFGAPTLQNGNSPLNGADFSNAILDGANLACGLDVSNAKFNDASMKNVRADWSMFNNSIFDGAVITNANFTNTDIEGAQFTAKSSSQKKAPILDGTSFAGSVVNYNTNFANNCSMIGVVFADSFGDGVWFDNVTLYMAVMAGLQINGLRITKSDARSCSFKDLIGNSGGSRVPISSDSQRHAPSFEGTNISGSFFDGSLLQNVNFSDTTLIKTDFGDAVVSSNDNNWQDVPTIHQANLSKVTCAGGSGLECVSQTQTAVPMLMGVYRGYSHARSVVVPKSFHVTAPSPATSSSVDINAQIQALNALCLKNPTTFCQQQVKLLQQAWSAGTANTSLIQNLLEQYKANEKNRPQVTVPSALMTKIKSRRGK